MIHSGKGYFLGFLSQISDERHYRVRIRIPVMHEKLMNSTDGECVRSCLDGHPDTYRHLVRRYEGLLLSYLTGLLGSRSGAEEAAQETFVRAYFALSKLRKPEAFFSWLLGIAVRVTKEYQRARQRDRRISRDVSEVPVAADLATKAPEDDSLLQAIATLPESCREVVLLRYYGGLSCAEVAARLDKTLGTVTKTLSRAYATLRESLAREDREVSR